MIIFSNPGEIDIEAVTVLGASIKAPGGSPIGEFGTGLKYSIAVLLREKLSIEIWSGLKRYSFASRTKYIRGEPFELIDLIEDSGERRQLGFTTSYGKNWTLEHVYRELWSNAKDENGKGEFYADGPIPAPFGNEGMTYVVIRGKAFEETHALRHHFLLSSSRVKIAEGPGLEVYAGSSPVVFYRGIAAHKFRHPSIFTYNITDRAQLTEDRTLSGGEYHLDLRVKSWLQKTASQELCFDALTASEGTYEQTLSFSSYEGFGQAFGEAVEQGVRENAGVNPYATGLYFSVKKDAVMDYGEACELTEEENRQLQEAILRIRSWGFNYAQWKFTIKVVEEAGAGVIARVNGKSECVLTRRALGDVDLLEHALIEEFIHMRDDVNDETRQMQNVLFREIVRLGRERPKEDQNTVSAELVRELAEADADEIPF